MSHILIDAAISAPVPLPYYCVAVTGESASIHDFDPVRGVYGTLGLGHNKTYFAPALVGLAIITEDEFMARQQPSVFVDGYLKGTE